MRMKNVLHRIVRLSTISFLIALCFVSCKKKNDDITVETLESKFAGKEGSVWRFPSSLLKEDQFASCTGDPLLLINNDGTYKCTQGTCTYKGKWEFKYAVNRTGQDITLLLFGIYNDQDPYMVKLQYSNEQVFYYLDPDNGLVALEQVKYLWEPVTMDIPASLLGRKDMTAVEYKGAIYFGMGIDASESTVYGDWFKFDGNSIVKLSEESSPLLYGAKAAVKNDSIYVMGGYDGYQEGVNNVITYKYDFESDYWDYPAEAPYEPIEQRANAVYFTLDNIEVLGLGTQGAASTIESNFYTRRDGIPGWISKNIITGKYGTYPYAYEDALYFPYQGAYIVGGGINDVNAQSDFMTKVSSANAITISNFGSNIAEFFPQGFSGGNGIDLENGQALVFGLKSGSNYSPDLYVLQGQNWTKEKPVSLDNTVPIVGRSTVLWKVKNPVTGKVEVYAGLGEKGSSLFKLVIR